MRAVLVKSLYQNEIVLLRARDRITVDVGLATTSLAIDLG
jgi:hypothetical protein